MIGQLLANKYLWLVYTQIIICDWLPEHGSGLLGGLSELSVDCNEFDAPRERCSWGEDMEESDGDGDLCWEGDSVLESLAVSVLDCSEKRRHEKKLGLVFLNDGELGGLGSLAGL